MAFITTRLSVNDDGTIKTSTPLPVGEHVAVVGVETELRVQEPTEPFDLSKWPQLDAGPWPEGMTFRREDIYGDDGR